ncbi:MAG: tRNA 2-thiocytidine(32) synthetase TtcA [Lachnospiraceae bacterium]|nr:tRNA 2-thiocytidine(32) synthetase TtcA [Lachnospiraceae bacterium]
MKLQKLLSLVRQALEKYQMIEEGDRIAVGVSGGKDSLTLLRALKELSRFYPKHFSVCAVSVDLGFSNTDFSGIQAYCEQLDVPLSIVHTQIGQIVMEERRESNPCSLCAKMRKGALVQEILRLGCNKIAYAHHKDDFVETMLMSLIFQGQFYAFPPVTWFEDTGLQILRPMMLVEEAEVKGFCNKYEIPVMKSPCPVDGTTKREYAKNLLRQIQKENPGAKERMFHAIVEGKICDWPNIES